MSAALEAFQNRRKSIAAAIDEALEQLLQNEPLVGESAPSPRLIAAMRHASLGGKRLRPFLVVESAALFNVPEARALPVGIAIECVHCYSLVHDDLPAMDNDDLRRGRPTLHRAFDEATAILAGDTLLTLAFELLAREATESDPALRSSLIVLIARAAGLSGMAGGQMLDLEAEGRFADDRRPLALPLQAIERMQSMKTAALLTACCEAGAILGRADDVSRRTLASYGRALGLAFQIADDLLDAEGEARAAGKAVAKDASRGKATIVSLLGPAKARERLAELVAEAETALAPFGARGAMLVAAARFVGERQT
jgi:farnesyl diphosphate synthase